MSRRLKTEPARLRYMPQDAGKKHSAAPLDRTGTDGDRIDAFGAGRREDPAGTARPQEEEAPARAGPLAGPDACHHYPERNKQI